MNSGDEVVVLGGCKRVCPGKADDEVCILYTNCGSDDVDVVDAKPSKKLQTVPAIKVNDDDDDCVILDKVPDISMAIVCNRADDDSDDLAIVGEKGEIACRDFPHSRHICALFPFASTAHESHCAQCHCYICNSPAPCSLWGSGTDTLDHCHATDKAPFWIQQRKSNVAPLEPNTPNALPVAPNQRGTHVPQPGSIPGANGRRRRGQLRIDSFFTRQPCIISEKSLTRRVSSSLPPQNPRLPGHRDNPNASIR